MQNLVGMNYSEILIGHAQLMVTLAGFSALMLALPTEDEEEVHAAWGARALIIQTVFSACMSLSGLGLLSTNIALGDVWRLSSLCYVVVSIPAVLLNIWDIRRVEAIGLRAKSVVVVWLLWLLATLGLVSNAMNIIAAEPIYQYFFWGLVCNALSGFILFTQNVILFTNDPDNYETADKSQ